MPVFGIKSQKNINDEFYHNLFLNLTPQLGAHREERLILRRHFDKMSIQARLAKVFSCLQ